MLFTGVFMEAFKEFQGKDVESAIEEACAYFHVQRNQLEIEVLKDAKSGIFGIVGTRNASIRARCLHGVQRPHASAPQDFVAPFEQDSATTYKPMTMDESQQLMDDAWFQSFEEDLYPAYKKNSDRRIAQKMDRPKRYPQRRQNAPQDVSSRQQRRPVAMPFPKQHPPMPDEGVRASQPFPSPARPMPAPEQGQWMPSPKPQPKQPPFPKEPPKPTAPHEDFFDNLDVPCDFDDVPEDIPEGLPLISREQITSPEFKEMLTKILNNMIEPILDKTVPLQFEFYKNSVRVHIDSGDQSGLLIVREGQTLIAIQYLTSRILTHKLGTAVRLQLDAGEYRQRQEEKLQEIALSLAERARQTGRPFSTRPLSSYHRRIIYLSLQNAHDIQTRSVGEGSMKRIVIVCKSPRNGLPQNSPF